MARLKPKQNTKNATKAEPFVATGSLPVPRELLSAGVPLDPEVEIERQKRLEALKATLTSLVARGEGARAIDQVLALVVDLERTNDRLAWRVLREVRFRYGRSSERLSREELGQLYLALGGDQATESASPNLDVPAPEQADDILPGRARSSERAHQHGARTSDEQEEAHFADLYAIEDDCKKRGLGAAARGEERRRRSLPLLDVFDDWVDDLHPGLLPKSPLRRATTYAINQREFFRRCFSDGRFEIDNGRVERRIRLYAVARRNFLFTGSPRGGERLAAIFTLVDNCLLLGIDPYAYLVDVIRKLEANWPLRLLTDLIPSRWAAHRAAEQASNQRAE